MQYGFYRYALQVYYGLLLKEHLPRTREMLDRECLEHHCERSLKLCNWASIHVSLFILLIGGAVIVNVQGCGMNWYLTSYLARLSTLTQTHSPSPILFKVCRHFKEGQNKIFLRNSFFSNSDIHKFFYSFIGCLQFIKCLLLPFDLIEKQGNIAMNY